MTRIRSSQFIELGVCGSVAAAQKNGKSGSSTAARSVTCKIWPRGCLSPNNWIRPKNGSPDGPLEAIHSSVEAEGTVMRVVARIRIPNEIVIILLRTRIESVIPGLPEQFGDRLHSQVIWRPERRVLIEALTAVVISDLCFRKRWRYCNFPQTMSWGSPLIPSWRGDQAAKCHVIRYFSIKLQEKPFLSPSAEQRSDP